MSTTTVRPETLHDERHLELLAVFGKAQFYVSNSRERLASYEKRATKGDAWYARQVPEQAAEVERYELSLRNARAELVAHDADYTGWSRYYLVVSSAGLVHRSMNCHTCNKGTWSTQFALLPSFSGLDAGALVKVYGAALCSVCFPDAPTSWVDLERFPTSLTEILLTQGEAAFTVAYEAYKVKRAAKAAALCPGSGTNAPPREGPPRYRSDYRLCPHCNERQAVTTTAKFRKHKGK